MYQYLFFDNFHFFNMELLTILYLILFFLGLIYVYVATCKNTLARHENTDARRQPLLAT